MQQYNHTETQFVSNNKTTNTIVLKELQRELLWCDRFYMSVAFITMSGITMILQQLKELEEKGVSGRILTSEYQYFNEPKVFEKLMSIPNIEVRVYTKETHHTKGYIFEKGAERSVIIGSSNLTANALKTNKEWNLKIEKHQEEKVIENLSEEFEEMWEESNPLTSQWIENYAIKYHESRILHTKLKTIESKDSLVIPNKMQVEALRNLEYLRSKNQKKALLISATGERVIIVMGAVCVIKSRVSGTLTKYISCIA